jgi:hypothetical protein
MLTQAAPELNMGDVEIQFGMDGSDAEDGPHGENLGQGIVESPLFLSSD